MKQIAWLFACALAGCQQPAAAPPGEGSAAPAPALPPSAYRQDIDNLCDAVARSGAAERPAAEHPLLVARWLGTTLTTDAAHQFLVKIQPLAGAAKADALDAEARRVGLPGCPLAAVWRANPEAVPPP
jgi:hypothetical protein